jgi:ribonuclease P protein component
VLSKKNRLSIRGRLHTIKTITSPFFIVKVAKNQCSESRFAVVVGKGIDKRAVGRNRLKRMVNKGASGLIEKIVPGFDFLIFVKKQAQEKQASELSEDLYKALYKEKLAA